MNLLQAFVCQFVLFALFVLYFQVRCFVLKITWKETFNECEFPLPFIIFLLFVWFVGFTWLRYSMQWPLLGWWGFII